MEDAVKDECLEEVDLGGILGRRAHRLSASNVDVLTFLAAALRDLILKPLLEGGRSLLLFLTFVGTTAEIVQGHSIMAQAGTALGFCLKLGNRFPESFKVV